MSDTIDIQYNYAFADGYRKQFTIRLDRDSLHLKLDEPSAPAFWTLLSHRQCSICTLDGSSHKHCPVALNLANIAEEFKDYFSHQDVTVTVVTSERTYSRTTRVQEGLSPLVGIVMVSSGCPVMEKLKPMVRFHLPFASLEETVFRMVSMYLVSQLLRHRQGKSAEWELVGLMDAYADVESVNGDFALRLRDAATKDANVNALVNLACLAQMLPMTIDDVLSSLENYFAAYL